MFEQLGPGRYRFESYSEELNQFKSSWNFLHFHCFYDSTIEIHKASKKIYISFSRPRGYNTFFVLNSVEHEILNAHKYKNIKKFGLFKAQLSLECYFFRSYMLKCQQLLAF